MTSKHVIENIYGLTPTQQGILYHHLAEPHSGQYILQQTFAVRGFLPDEVVRGALRLLSLRHDAVRTAFVVPKASGKPRQVLLADRQAAFGAADLRGLPADAQQRRLAQLEKEDIARGFDLERDPLLRLTLVRLAEDQCSLILTAHHIILDGWSMPIIMKDFAGYGAALMANQDMALLEAAAVAGNRSSTRCAQYIRWLNERDTTADLSYWQTLLAEPKDTAGILPLRIPSPTPDGLPVHVQTVTLSEPDSQRLAAVAAAEGATVGTLLATVWGLLLQYYNNTDDVVFGKVVSGRDVPLAGVETMAGLFINTMPVRLQTQPGQTTRSLLREQQSQSLAGDEHSPCALADIQRLCAPGKGSELFATLFAFENYFTGEASGNGLSLPGLELSLSQGREQTNYPISLRASSDDTIRAEVLYDPSQYADEDMRTLLRRYRTLLLNFVAGMDLPVAQLSCLDSEEYTEIFSRFVDPGSASTAMTTIPATSAMPDPTAPRSEATVSSVFREIATAYPGKTAICLNGISMTYAELDEQSNRLAHTLRGLGVAPDTLAALFCRRRPECIVGILAIIKAGGAYLPLDPETPEERIRFVCTDSAPKVMLSLGGASVSFPGVPCLDLLDQSVYAHDAGPLTLMNKPEHLAYCIYTSGTTGRPKGVLIEHRNLINLISHAAVTLGISPEDRLLQFSNFTFDASVWEIFCSLLNGAALILVEQDVILDNDRFLIYAEEQGITAALLPPHYYRQGKLEGLKRMITGGSPATPDIVTRAARRGAYWNAYGPTEATVASHFWWYEPGTAVPETIPIGKPIPNTQNFILQGTRLCGAGIPGELCLCGAGLARGYLNRPELTGERFTDNPFATGRLYRTGDLARWLPDGNVEYLGRMDDQVKVRGYRVELGDVENALRTLPQVTDAVVAARSDAAGSFALHAYVTGTAKLDMETLRTALLHKLPSYMVPALFAQIDAIPMNRHGKADRGLLPAITPQAVDIKPPRNNIETQALEIFRKALGLTEMSIDQDFFEAGGDSIKAIQISSQLGALDLAVSVRDVFGLRTVEKIVADASARLTSTQPPASHSSSHEPRTPNFEHPSDSAPSHHEPRTPNLEQRPWEAYEIHGPLTEEKPLSVSQQASARMGVLGALGAAEIQAPWDADRFLNTWRRLLDETPILRSEICLNSDAHSSFPAGRQRQRQGEPDIVPFVDLSMLDPGKRSAALQQLAFRAATPYITVDAYTDNFLCVHRLLCAKTEPDRFFVLMPVSHLVFDGFSNEVFARRLRALYAEPDAAPVTHAGSMADYEAFVLQGPDGPSDDDLVRELDLERFHNCVSTQRSARQTAENARTHATLSFPLREAQDTHGASPNNLLTLGERLCAEALRFSQPTGSIPLLLVSSARNYKGCNFSDSIGEFIDLVPVVWQDDEPFAAARQRVLPYVREHRVNICSLLHSMALRERYPRATALLTESLILEQLDVQALNMLVLYGSQAILPDTPPDMAAESPNRHVFLNVYAQEGTITIENVLCKAGEIPALRAHLAKILSDTNSDVI